MIYGGVFSDDNHEFETNQHTFRNLKQVGVPPSRLIFTTRFRPFYFAKLATINKEG